MNKVTLRYGFTVIGCLGIALMSVVSKAHPPRPGPSPLVEYQERSAAWGHQGKVIDSMKNLRNELMQLAQGMEADSGRTMTADTYATYAAKASDLVRETEKYAASYNNIESIISKHDLRELKDAIDSKLKWFKTEGKIVN
jgi:hypothetical protein